MNCPACGFDNPEGGKFCGNCAQPLKLVCPQCGFENPPGFRFCGECATPLGRTHASATRDRSSPRDPRAYTPKHLADKILQSKSAIEGERKQVTVLFADVKGSMELAEQIDPEVWHQILDRFFQILTDGVHRFEGTVNQYTGDGIMALFGAPLAHEDHARRACYAALYLRDELRRYTREIRRERGLDFSVRMGLNSGDVVVGKIGDDLRMDYTALGHTVGLAQRMEQIAEAGSAYMTAHTAAHAAGYFELEDLGAFEIKGVGEPLGVYELRGVGAMRTRFDLSRARGLSRFVGRTDEMAMLETALEQGMTGPGRTLGVVAQAGTGKSRLCYEFLERCRSRGLTVYEARGVSHGRHIPLLPVLELFRSFFGIDDRDPDRVAREKIAGRVLLLDHSLRDELPMFFDLLGVPDPERPLPAGDPDMLQRRLFAAIRAIVIADARVEPGLLLVEDMHWLDAASDTVLQQIIEANAASRGLVLVNFRPEYEAGWMQRGYYQQLSLLPLGPAEIGDLLQNLLGSDSSVAELSERIRERTAGNPFFIEEIVQGLIETGALAGQKGALRLTRPVASLAMPDTVQAILAARIDRLPEREKRVVQTAAVIGKTFRERLLAAIVELSEMDLREALRVLEDAEFLYEACLYPELELSFKHPLTQEVADRSQLAERRRRAHAAVARAIEVLDTDRLDEQAALLAHHCEEAAENERAAHWHARAAGRMGATDYGEAYTHWQRVDRLLRDVELTPDVEELQTRAFKEQLKLAFRVGMADDDAAALMERGQSFLIQRGNDRALAEVLCAYGALRQSAGELTEYLDLAKGAATAARRTGDPVLQAAVTLDVMWGLLLKGCLAEAVATAEEVPALVGDDPDLGTEIFGYSPLISTLAFSATSFVYWGQLDEGDRRIDTALRLAADRVAAETLGWLHGMRIEVALARGDVDKGLRAGRQCLELAERSGSRFDAVAARCWAARAHIACGNWQDGVDLLEAATDLSTTYRIAVDILLTTRWAFPIGYLGLGDIERARALGDEAVDACTAQGARVYLCRAYISRAAVARAEADSRRAAIDLDAAEQLANETGARLFLPMIHEERSLLGSRAERGRHLREAHRLFAEMGATGHAERMARELSASSGATTSTA